MKTARKPGTAEQPVATPQEIYDHLERHVIGQERAKRALSVAGYNHFRRIETQAQEHAAALRKSNVMLIGPTGCGKTHLARTLADVLDAPFVAVDATEYTEAGYYGKDVEMMISELYQHTGSSVDDTQHGIVFIDELDKIARRSHGSVRTGAGTRDIGGEGVQQSLLKLLEGREVFVPTSVAQHWSKNDFVQIDTRHILFICAGTFTDLYDERAEQSRRTVGFGTSTAPRRPRRIEPHELVSYGILRELLARIPVVVELEPLGRDDLVHILLDPPDALVREYREALALDDVGLEFTEDALSALAEHALARGDGARGLRAAMEDVMRDVMFEAPEKPGETFTLDADYVRKRL